MSKLTHGFNPTFKKVHRLWLDGHKPGRILDVGCTDGSFCIPLEKAGWNCYGVDRKKAHMAVDMPMKILDLNTDKLPYKCNYFDVIYAGELIEHLTNADFFLRQIHRILKDDGIFILTTPNVVYLRDRIRVLFGKRQVALETPLHCRFYTFDTIGKLLRDNGFSVEECRGSYFLKSTLPFAYTISDIYPELLSYQIILKSEKVKP